MENITPARKRMPILSLVLREKKFLINSNFQLQFMASLIIVAVLSMTIIYIANDYFFHTYVARGQALNLPPDHPYFLMIHEQKKFMTQVFFFVAATISVLGSLWGLLYSHKIAGPLYRLHTYFTEAAKSTKPIDNKIYFREDDFFQEVPDAINNYIDSVEKRKAIEKEKIAA